MPSPVRWSSSPIGGSAALGSSAIEPRLLPRLLSLALGAAAELPEPVRLLEAVDLDEPNVELDPLPSQGVEPDDRDHLLVAILDHFLELHRDLIPGLREVVEEAAQPLVALVDPVDVGHRPGGPPDDVLPDVRQGPLEIATVPGRERFLEDAKRLGGHRSGRERV